MKCFVEIPASEDQNNDDDSSENDVDDDACGDGRSGGIKLELADGGMGRRTSRRKAFCC